MGSELEAQFGFEDVAVVVAARGLGGAVADDAVGEVPGEDFGEAVFGVKFDVALAGAEGGGAVEDDVAGAQVPAVAGLVLQLQGLAGFAVAGGRGA